MAVLEHAGMPVVFDHPHHHHTADTTGPETGATMS
jgi:hypothetical protein